MKTIAWLWPWLSVTINLSGASTSQTVSLEEMLVEKPCCEEIQLVTSSDLGPQTSKVGVYRKVAGEEKNGRPVYVSEKFSFWRLFWCMDSWTIGEFDSLNNYTTDTCGAGIKNKNPEGYFCPEDAIAPWQYFGEDFIWSEIKGGKFECSDCSVHPNQPECEKCCDKLILNASHKAWTNTSFYTSNLQGDWRFSNNWLNGSPVYTSESNQTICVWRSNCGYWQINLCSATESCTLEPAFSSDGMGLKDGPRCVEHAKDWRFGSNMEKDAEMGFSCIGQKDRIGKISLNKLF